jgi:hypothetical protein
MGGASEQNRSGYAIRKWPTHPVAKSLKAMPTKAFRWD